MQIVDGKYIASDETNLFVRAIGSGHSTIIIEPGWGILSIEWSHIQKELAKEFSVVCYDRAGYGESPKSKKPRNSKQIALELYAMLANSNFEPPYVFISYAEGGIYTQHFAKMFPRIVAGIIFVDSTTVYDAEFDQIESEVYQERFSTAAKMKMIKSISEVPKEKLAEEYPPFLRRLYQHLPVDFREAIVAYQSVPTFYSTIYNEYELALENYKDIEAIDGFPNIPIKVLIRDSKKMIELSEKIGLPLEEARILEELWLKHSKSLLDLSNQSELIIVKDSSHLMHYDAPNAIIEATKDLIAKL